MLKIIKQQECLAVFHIFIKFEMIANVKLSKIEIKLLNFGVINFSKEDNHANCFFNKTC